MVEIGLIRKERGGAGVDQWTHSSREVLAARTASEVVRDLFPAIAPVAVRIDPAAAELRVGDGASLAPQARLGEGLSVRKTRSVEKAAVKQDSSVEAHIVVAIDVHGGDDGEVDGVEEGLDRGLLGVDEKIVGEVQRLSLIHI